ncbi:MAG: chorismate mutase [Leptolyngbyaceae cyanobacterium RU_5_1]|nr:chorismate mutase [Leptolyngbyaceae cyanobacterium RU_5_1]
MKHRSMAAVLISISWLTTTRPSLAQTPTSSTLSLAQQADEVSSLLEGKMDTSAQAMANSKAPSVRMTTCRIQVSGTPANQPSIFLYQEQALTHKLAQPYRQRFLEISPNPSSQSVRSLSFKPANPAPWAGFCNKPTAERIVNRNDLGSPICSVFLKRSGNRYIGNTPINGCPTNVRGAVRVTNRIELSKSGMNTWDRGFDANGKQVWGAQSESYQYRRIE